MLASLLMTLNHFRYVTNMAFDEGVTCPALHIQFFRICKYIISFLRTSQCERAMHTYLKIVSISCRSTPFGTNQWPFFSPSIQSG